MIRLFHTVRYLRPVQVADRLRRTLLPFRHLPNLSGQVLLCSRRSILPASPREGSYDGHSFRFLNHGLPFEGENRWRPEGADRLWVYNLHYFQYIHSLPPSRALALISDWIEANKDPAGPGWEPYPIAMRVREWIEWLIGHADLEPSRLEALSANIAIQTEALARQIEYHLLGNHLLEDAITLCWAGLSLEGPAAKGWLEKGHEILKKQLACQVLQDGTHEERSPMYQALLAEALLRLAEVAGCSARARAREIRTFAEAAGRAMLASLGRFVHPDGDYALFNDCALGIAPTIAELNQRFPEHLSSPTGTGGGVWRLHDAGYMGWESAAGGYMIYDAGAMGPDHQPGHGHADVLSFELSHHGRRVVTDTGVYSYNAGDIRSYDRGTSAHNTLQLDNFEQAELWSAFRCGRRPMVLEANLEESEEMLQLAGSYEAPLGSFSTYRHGRNVARTGGEIRFLDEVNAAGAHTAILRLHLAPGITLGREGSGWNLLDRTSKVASIFGEGFEWAEGRSPYHPQFGIEVERASLVARLPFRDRAHASWSILLH